MSVPRVTNASRVLTGISQRGGETNTFGSFVSTS